MAKLKTENKYWVTSRVLCQQERGSDSLLFVLIGEHCKQDSIHAGSVREDTHGTGSPSHLPESSLDGICGAGSLSPAMFFKF
jgi:hypothetical protein